MKRSAGANLLFDRKWIRLAIKLYLLGMLIFFAFFILSYYFHGEFGSLYHAEPVFSGIYFNDASAIFLNNSLVAILDMIPIIGILHFALSTAVTGIRFGYHYYLSSGRNFLYNLILNFFSPILWLESMGYAIAIAENVYITKAILDGKLRSELERAYCAFVVMITLLCFSALLEAIIFQDTKNQILYYVPWLPILLVIFILYKWKTKYLVMIKEELLSVFEKTLRLSWIREHLIFRSK